MELRFNVTEKQGVDNSHLALVSGKRPTSALSCQNILAFIRINTRPDAIKNMIPVYTVCVADLNTVFEPHVIIDCLDSITHLKFDSTGCQLLVVTRLGVVMMFKKGAALHDWVNCNTSQWTGEDILHIDFFHMGVKPCFQTGDIKVNASYSDKVVLQPHTPTLSSFVNTPLPGYFAISSSGLILVCLLNTKLSCIEEQKIVLGKTRENLIKATAALGPGGMVHIAAWQPDTIKCWNVQLLSLDNELDRTISNVLLKVTVTSAQSFSPMLISDQKPNAATMWKSSKPKLDTTINVSKLHFPEFEDPNNLLVIVTVKYGDEVTTGIDGRQTKTASSKSYFIQRYQLQDRTKPILQVFNTMKVSNTVTKEWICIGEWQSSSEIMEIGTPIRQLLPTNQLAFIITIATADGTIYSLNKDTMVQMSNYNLHNARSTDDTTQTKKLCQTKYGTSLTHTWTGLSVVVIDNLSNVYFLSLMKAPDVGQTWLTCLVALLEFSLVSGNDWFDLLLSTPSSSIVTVTDRLSDVFQQHPSHITQLLNTRILVIKNSILKLSTSLHHKSIECRLQTQLLSILKLFRSLRPVTDDIVGADKNVANTVQAFIENRFYLETHDLDKAVEQFLCSGNILDFQLDPRLLKDLQALLQFTYELGLYLILMLVQNPKHEPSRDMKTLQSIREILFVSRIWYHHSRLLVPQMYRKTDTVDVWSQIYKLITRLVQSLPTDPDPNFIDECILLETQVVCRDMALFLPPRGVLANVAATHAPIQFNFGMIEPQSLPTCLGRPLEGALPASLQVDPLFNHFLAPNDTRIQSCTRCHGYRGSWWSDGDSMWEQQWAGVCLCSGYWGPPPPSQTTNAA